MNDTEEEKFPFRYSTVAYMDVHAFSDKEHEVICGYLKKILEGLPLVFNVQIGEC